MTEAYKEFDEFVQTVDRREKRVKMFHELTDGNRAMIMSLLEDEKDFTPEFIDKVITKIESSK
jgi:predicted translin family RNA/ssDNA-binding protein